LILKNSHTDIIIVLQTADNPMQRDYFWRY